VTKTHTRLKQSCQHMHIGDGLSEFLKLTRQLIADALNFVVGMVALAKGAHSMVLATYGGRGHMLTNRDCSGCEGFLRIRIY
jgi:hypothetical protein